MEKYIIPIQLRWSDLDPNFHIRHSIYYDWGALSRVEFLVKSGLDTSIMQQLHIGPILFREECIFKREIRDGDKITVDLALLKARKDYSRWSIRHQIMKNDDIIAAILTVDGAWLDTQLRKLAAPPPQAVQVFSSMPLDKEFQWTE